MKHLLIKSFFLCNVMLLSLWVCNVSTIEKIQNITRKMDVLIVNITPHQRLHTIHCRNNASLSHNAIINYYLFLDAWGMWVRCKLRWMVLNRIGNKCVFYWVMTAQSWYVMIQYWCEFELNSRCKTDKVLH